MVFFKFTSVFCETSVKSPVLATLTKYLSLILPKSTLVTVEFIICLHASSTSNGIPKNFEKSFAVPTGKIPIGNEIPFLAIVFTTESTVPSPPATKIYSYSLGVISSNASSILHYCQSCLLMYTNYIV